MAKKKPIVLGKDKPKTIEITYYSGAAIVDSLEDATAVLQAVEDAQAAIKPILQFIEQGKKSVTGWMLSSAVDTVQLDECYYRRIQRHNRFFIGTDEQMPDPKPKGAKSMKEIVKGRFVRTKDKKIKLWNAITTRVIDPEKLDLAVKKGYLTEKEVDKAYYEKPQNPFVQRFAGVADKDD